MQVEVPLDDPGGLLGEVVPIVGVEEVPVGLVVVLVELRRPVLVVVLAPLVPSDCLREGTAPDPGAFQEEGLVVPRGDDVEGLAAGRGSSSTATAAGTRTPRRRGVVIHTLILALTASLVGGQRMDSGQDDVEQIPPRHPVPLGLAVIGGLLDGPHLMAEIGQDGVVVLVGLRARGRVRAGR